MVFFIFSLYFSFEYFITLRPNQMLLKLIIKLLLFNGLAFHLAPKIMFLDGDEQFLGQCFDSNGPLTESHHGVVLF
jgi:hypothetical protein